MSYFIQHNNYIIVYMINYYVRSIWYTHRLPITQDWQQRSNQSTLNISSTVP